MPASVLETGDSSGGKTQSVQRRATEMCERMIQKRAEKNPMQFAKKLTTKERELLALRYGMGTVKTPKAEKGDSAAKDEPDAAEEEPPKIDEDLRNVIAERAFSVAALPMDEARRPQFEARLKRNKVLNDELNHGISSCLEKIIWAGRWGRAAVAYGSEFLATKWGIKENARPTPALPPAAGESRPETAAPQLPSSAGNSGSQAPPPARPSSDWGLGTPELRDGDNVSLQRCVS